jgi:outer membrane protein assembly factor BamB
MDSVKQTGRHMARPRWWPFWVVLGAAFITVVAIRLWPELSYQERNLGIAEALFISLVLLILWLAFFSRLRGRLKAALLGSLLGIVALTCSLVRIRGVSGDLLPILGWRFQRSRAAQPAGPVPSTPLNSPPLEAASPTNDYPQFLGAHRNGVIDGPELGRSWSEQPPRLLWRKTVGPSWSGFAIAGNRAITLEQHGEKETAIACDLLSGTVLWRSEWEAHYQTTIAGDGPRTTPTVVGPRVYIVGATGLLQCLDLATGRLLWTKDVPKDSDGKVGDWGVSCSPLVLGRSVIVTTGAKNGRSLAAYDTYSGARLWAAGDDRASYSSPISAMLGGTEQIVIFNSSNVSAHQANSGALLWQHPWPGGHPHIVTPLILSNDQMVVSSGYGTGSELLQITHSPEGQWHAERVWKSNRLKSKFANLIQQRGYLYGLDDGIMVCVKAATGELQWKEGRYGHGQMILRGDLLLVMAENGDVVLVEPAPEQHRELARFNALRGKTWNPPALAGAHLLVRNDQEAACYELPTAAGVTRGRTGPDLGR